MSRQKDSTNTTKTTLLAQHKILKQRQQLRFDDNTLKSVTTKAFECHDKSLTLTTKVCSCRGRSLSTLKTKVCDCHSKKLKTPTNKVCQCHGKSFTCGGSNSTRFQGPVVQSPISTNPGLTLSKTYGVNPGLLAPTNQALNNRAQYFSNLKMAGESYDEK